MPSPTLTIDPKRLSAAMQRARQDLLSERTGAGHWIGELATSALSTATAVSALAITGRNGAADGDLETLVRNGVRWLLDHQNPDGGWGDTLQGYSNIATSMLAVAAIHLAEADDVNAEALERANHYIDGKERIAGLRARYGKDKTFAVPILTNCALAGLVSWREVSPLPFELACFPQGFYRFLQMPVVSYAIPALVAIGQARYFHQPPWNPFSKIVRAASVQRSLTVLRQMQPASGGYLEAVPLTSFVLMSLSSTGRAEHAVAQSGVQFLKDSVRPDGSWPIDTNLATWNTTLSLNALSACGEDIAQLSCLPWLLSCQHRERHPFTGADPGGWGWSDLSGAVPDSDDTPGALLALAAWRDAASCNEEDLGRIREAVIAGVDWLIRLQNSDGGWPTFCRGWGKLPFDRSGSDLTAHALRAINAWRDELDAEQQAPFSRDQVRRAVERGLSFLERSQQSDGSWVPLWFGNQDHPQEENPVYGTSKVLLAYRDLGKSDTSIALRGFQWLGKAANEDGGWGGGVSLDPGRQKVVSSVEETALAVESLLAAPDQADVQVILNKGLQWLVETTESGGHDRYSPIGFYFAKLWYHERLYPLIFTASALGKAALQPAAIPPEDQPADTPAAQLNQP